MTTLSKYLPSSFLIKYTTSYTSPITENWNKQGGSTGDTVIAVVVGGGGSGARGTMSDGKNGGPSHPVLTGGGGGGVSVVGMPYEECPSSVSIVVGQGGTVVSSDGNGNSGFNSSFGNFAIATGGQGGRANNGGTWARGGSSIVGTSANNANETAWADGQRGTGGDSRYADLTTNAYGISAGLTGGGGSIGNYGASISNGTGRKGSLFGEGGDAGIGSAAAAGTSPGGGGGAYFRPINGASLTSGAGGTGAVYIYVVKGFASASDILVRIPGRNITVMI